MSVIDRFRGLNLLKNAGIYTGSSILSSLVPFICMPVLTRYLTPEDYGVVAMMGSIISFLTPFVGLNIHGAIAVVYYHEGENFNEFVKTTNSLLMLSSSLVFVVILFFSSELSEFTFFPADWLWVIVVICMFQFYFNIHLTILQIKQCAVNYGSLQILNVILNAGLSIFLVVVLTMNWQGRILAQVISLCVCVLCSIIFFYKNKLLGLSLNANYIKYALSFGVPLIPHAIAGSLLTVLDRFYVAKFVDLSTAGLFVLGAQIGSGIELITSSFNKAYVPWLFEKLKKSNDSIKHKIVGYTYVYFVGILILALGYSFVMPYFLSFFVGDRFQSASSFVWPFAIAGSFGGMYYMVVNYIFYEGKTAQLMVRTILIGIIHAFLSFLFTSRYGVSGACWCVVISYFLMFIFTWQLSNKVYKMPWGKYIFQDIKDKFTKSNY